MRVEIKDVKLAFSEKSHLTAPGSEGLAAIMMLLWDLIGQTCESEREGDKSNVCLCLFFSPIDVLNGNEIANL